MESTKKVMNGLLGKAIVIYVHDRALTSHKNMLIDQKMMELKISLLSGVNWANQGKCWIISFKSLMLVGYKEISKNKSGY